MMEEQSGWETDIENIQQWNTHTQNKNQEHEYNVKTKQGNVYASYRINVKIGDGMYFISVYFFMDMNDVQVCYFFFFFFACLPEL